MRILSLLVAMLAASAMGCAFVVHGDPSLVVYGNPPAEPTEGTPAPRLGWIWIHGFWQNVDGEWRWSGGRWEPARPGYSWRDGYWSRHGRTYQWIEGGWERSP